MSPRVTRGTDAPVRSEAWGTLQWLVGGDADAWAGMTLGRVTFKPGQANPSHLHPNCDEVLFVVAGELDHSLPEGGFVRLAAGDCILLPRGRGHFARNVGADEAVVVVAYNSAHRHTVGE